MSNDTAHVPTNIESDHVGELDRANRHAVISGGLLEPDLTLLLDLPVAVGLDRARARRQANGESVTDRFESETLQFFERVRASYLAIAQRDARRCRLIDAAADAQTVRAAALSVLKERWG